MTTRRSDSLLQIHKVRMIAFNPDVYDLAAAIPQPEVKTGRPRQFPDEVLVLFLVVAASLGSARKAASAMRCPDHWHIVLDGIAACLGKEFAESLPAGRGPTRNQWLYHARRIEKHIVALSDRFRANALAQAMEAGHFDPTRPNSVVPCRADMVASDGTVVASPIRGRKRTDKKPRRVDTGAGWHVEGGEDDGTKVYGCKYVFVSTRSDENVEHTRIVLDVRHQPPGKGYGGEAGIALQAIAALREKAPGLRGACCDGAFRGKHRNALMKRGLVVVTPHHSGATPRAHLLVKDCPCGRNHDLWIKDGAVCVRTINIEGEEVIEPLEIAKVEHRERTTTHSWYLLLRLPCGNLHRERIDTTVKDVANGFNRAEHIHQHPPGTDGYKALYGYREDAESLHSTLNADLWNRRMIAYGAQRQTLMMLGFAMGQNSRERWFREAEKAPPLVA